MVMLKLKEQPLLIQAIFNADIEDVRALLETKPDVNYQDAEKRSPLHAAAYIGDKELTALLLEQGARVNTKDSSWLTPLHRACGVCADDIVELLLQHKADTTARDRQWQTPLHIAAANNAVGSIRHLLAHITNVNVTDRSGCTALHHAALNGHNEVVELLLSKGSIVNACDKKDCRPIHWAAVLGHDDTVNILIQRGADINVKDRNQYTPLHAAVFSGFVYVANLLLNMGADVNAQNAYGNTPLHIACLNGHLSICQLLLQHNANLEAVNYKGQTPLHVAAVSTEGAGCLAYLLEQEKIDINRQSADGRTPLHMTAIYGRFTRSKRLIDKGATVDCADKNGNTALHIAAQYGHDILTATLLDFGADAVKRGYEGRTPLHVCCLSGFVEVCRKFLQRAVDLNVVDDNGRTPIHCAAYKGSVECLDLLVSRGGDFKLQDNIGRTALHYAAVRGHYNCVYTLVGIGTPVNIIDIDGCSALHLAAAYDTESKCVEYLLQHKADPLLKDGKGFNPIHYAVNGSNRSALELLLKAVGKHVNFLEVGMPDTTPLHLAARHGELNILRSIIPYFPETNIKTSEGYTPLLIAAREGHTPNVQMLLRYGAKVAICDDVAGMSPVHHSAKNGHLHCLALLVDNAEVKTIIDKRDHYERTALMLAISGSHQDCALTLLKSSSDPNVVDADLHSPLFRAVVTDQTNVVQLLIGCGSKLTEPDVNGKTVLHLAAACGHLKCLQKLMQNVDEQQALVLDKHGFSVLHWACYYGNASCLEFLLQKGIFARLEGNVFTPVHCAAFTGSDRCLELLHAKFGVECLTAKDTRNRTPLHLAAWHGHAECVRFLLDNNCEVEARDELGRTPLISAAQNGQSQVIDLLLVHKADLRAADVNGCTALHVACMRKHNHTALLLLEYITDADVINMVDNEKKTALHLSARNGLVEVTAELIKKGASVIATDNNGLTPALYCAPNACVAQCLAIILAHHPTEITGDNIHTKATYLLRNAILTSTRIQPLLKLQSSQTDLSLLRNPDELLLEATATHAIKTTHRRRHYSVTPAVVPPLQLSMKYSGHSLRNNQEKQLILVENYDRDEFDVSLLKQQKGHALHRSYSEMALSQEDSDDTISGLKAEDNHENEHNLKEETYRKLIDGYKTIALKMARVSSKYDVSVDEIQKTYIEQYTRRKKHSISCPMLTTSKQHQLQQQIEERTKTLDRRTSENLLKIKEFQQKISEKSSSNPDIAKDLKMPKDETLDDNLEDKQPSKETKLDEAVLDEDETLGLPPYAPPLETATPTLCFASFSLCETTVSTGTDPELMSTTSSDGLSNGDLNYDYYSASNESKSYCSCKYVCKDCVLVTRFDFQESSHCFLTGLSRERDYIDDHYPGSATSYRNEDIHDDEDQSDALIPLENLIVVEPRVYVGEGAIKKSRTHEIRNEISATTPEKLKSVYHQTAPPTSLTKCLLNEMCEAEKIRRAVGHSRDVREDEKQKDVLDIGLDCLDPLNFPDDFLDAGDDDDDDDDGENIGKVPSDMDVTWPKVTFDEGCIKMQDLQSDEECAPVDCPTKDIIWCEALDSVDAVDDNYCGGGRDAEEFQLDLSMDEGLSLGCVDSCTNINIPIESTQVAKEESSVLPPPVPPPSSLPCCDDKQGETTPQKLVKDENVIVLPPGGITTLASPFIPSATGNKHLKLQRSGLTLNEIPTTLLKHQPGDGKPLLRDSAAIVDFTALFAKTRKSRSNEVLYQQKKVAPSTSSLSTPASPTSAKGVRQKNEEINDKFLSVVRYAQDKIQRYTYQEMVDLSEGLNLSNEAKAIARRLIEQLAKKQKPVKTNTQVDAEEAVLTTVTTSRVSDSGSDSGCESITANSLESMDTSSWSEDTISEDCGSEGVVMDEKIVLQSPRTSSTKLTSKRKKHDDNKCCLQ